MNSRKIMAILIIFIFILMLCACGSKSSDSDSSGSENSNSKSQNNSDEGYPDYVYEDGITITLWHSRGTGANGTEMENAVQKFNETNEYGIHVVSEYIGSTSTILSKSVTAIAAGNNPTLVILDNGGVPTLAEKGVLADLSGYVERDGFDMDNIINEMTGYVYYGDQIISFPFVRSTAVLYYNPTIFAQAGVEVPTSYEELINVGPIITQKTGISAYCILINAGYYQEGVFYSLAQSGSVNADGTGSDILTNGALKTVLTDWKEWIDAGWCDVPAITNDETVMRENFYQGKLASMVLSSGAYENVVVQAAENGVDVGVAYNIAYGGFSTAGGGGNIAVIERNNSQQEIAAAWEFIKFLMEDDQVISNAINTGYLPVTYSAAESAEIQGAWNEDPYAAIAYNQLEYCVEPQWSIHSTEWIAAIKTGISYVIQDGSKTVDEAIDYLASQEKIIFSE